MHSITKLNIMKRYLETDYQPSKKFKSDILIPAQIDNVLVRPEPDHEIHTLLLDKIQTIEKLLFIETEKSNQLYLAYTEMLKKMLHLETLALQIMNNSIQMTCRQNHII